MSLTVAQRQALIESESLGEWGRQALRSELERLTAERDKLPLAGDLGDTPRNGLNRVLFDITARLAVPDPLAPVEASAVEARLAERQKRRATAASLHEELRTATPGSVKHDAILEDIVEYSRAVTDQEGA